MQMNSSNADINNIGVNKTIKQSTSTKDSRD